MAVRSPLAILLLASLLVLPAAAGGAPAPSAPDAGAALPREGEIQLPPGKAPLAPPAEPRAAVGLPISAPGPEDDCGTGGDVGGWEDPARLDLPAECEGELRDLEDEYVFRVPALHTLVVRVELVSPPEGASVYACIAEDTEDVERWYASARCVRATAEPALLTTALVEELDYSLFLYGSYGEDVGYAFSASSHGWVLGPDCGTETDAPDAADGALAVALGGACGGFLNPADDLADVYHLALAPGEAALVRLAPNAEADFDLCVYDSPDLARPIGCSIHPSGLEDVVFVSPGVGGEFWIRVEWWDGAEAYDLAVLHAPPADDCGTGADGGSAWRSVPVAAPLACDGAVDRANGDRWDLYAFDVQQGGIRVSLHIPYGDAYLCIFAPGESWSTRCLIGEDLSFAYMTAVHGTWRVGVVHNGGAGSYHLTAATFEPAPQDDCGAGADAASGAPLGSPAVGDELSCEGYLAQADGDWRDTYGVDLPASALRLVAAVPDGVRVCVWSSQTYQCPDAVDGVVQMDVQVLEASSWSVSFWSSQGLAGGAYSLHLEFAAPYDDCGTGADAGGLWPYDPAPLALPAVRCEGTLFGEDGDHSDQYLVSAAAGDELVVALEHDAEDFFAHVCVWPADRSVYTCSFFGGAFPKTLVVPVDEPGDYVIEVGGAYSGETAYRLSVALVGASLAPA